MKMARISFIENDEQPFRRIVDADPSGTVPSVMFGEKSLKINCEVAKGLIYSMEFTPEEAASIYRVLDYVYGDK